MKKLFKTVCWVCRYVKIKCIGNRMRKQFFLEKLLERSNQVWFAFPQEVFKEMCNDLSSRIQGDYMCVNDLFIEGSDGYSIHQKTNELHYPLSMLLKVDAHLSFGLSLQGRRAKVVLVRAYHRVRRGVKQFVKAHFRLR